MKEKSQYEQVIEAIKSLKGKKGTLSQICEAIPNLKNWKTITPKASVSNILSKGKLDFEKDTDNNRIWVYIGNKKAQKIDIKKTSGNPIENVIYLITVSDSQKQFFQGFPFKIGKAEKDLKGRLKGYNQSLPFETIKFICYYPVTLPNGVKLVDIESQIISRLRELTKKDYLGLRLISLIGGNQSDWFISNALNPDSKDHISKLSDIIGKIIKEVVVCYTKK